MTTPTLPPKKFLNEDTVQSVNEFIEGLLLSHPQTLKRLSNQDVVLANPLPAQEVRILSGGGSGHEPSHAGWIGDGMLTGAILGGIFASPSVNAILSAIRAVTPADGSHSCLLIVKNYTGDRLNFGMATELANIEGRRTAMIVVSDDCAIPRTKGHTGARGVAGTVLVHKVAGAAAAQGKTLDEVVKLAQLTCDRIGSLGVTLDAVTLPGATERNTRLDGNKIEIGLGIHGEAGIRQSPVMTADDIAKEMLSTIHAFGYELEEGGAGSITKLEEGDEVVLVVNNLGGTSNFELSVMARSLVRYLEGEHMKCKVGRVYVGAFMTAFNMHGVSASVLRMKDVNDVIGPMLDAPTTAPAWFKAEVYSPNDGPRPSQTPYPEVPAPEATSSDNADESSVTISIPNFDAIVKAAITKSCNAIIALEPKLTEWDTIVGDGDCGITQARGANEVLSRLNADKLNVSNPAKLYLDLADAVSSSMGGTSGILIELFFRKAAVSIMDATKKGEPITETVLAQSFVDGVKAVGFYGGAGVGSRTMMDALCPASDAAAAVGGGGAALASAVANAATEGAKSTSSMTEALAGRSNYLSEEQLTGTPDPGAMAIATILEAIADTAAGSS